MKLSKAVMRYFAISQYRKTTQKTARATKGGCVRTAKKGLALFAAAPPLACRFGGFVVVANLGALANKKEWHIPPLNNSD